MNDHADTLRGLPAKWRKEAPNTVTAEGLAICHDHADELDAAIAALEAGRSGEARQPDGYAYRYPDGCIRHNNGREVNGSTPTEAIPYYYATAPQQPTGRSGEAVAEVMVDAFCIRNALDPEKREVLATIKLAEGVDERRLKNGTKLYDHPQQPPPVGVTDAMVDRMIARYVELEPADAEFTGAGKDCPETRDFCRELLTAALQAARPSEPSHE